MRTALGLASGATTTVGTAASQNTGTSGATLPFLNGINVWSGSQRYAVVALTDAASITSDFSLGNNFSVTLGGNRARGH